MWLKAADIYENHSLPTAAVLMINDCVNTVALPHHVMGVLCRLNERTQQDEQILFVSRD